MADMTHSTPAARVSTSVRPISLSSTVTTRLPVLDRAAQDILAEHAAPGVLLVASLVESLLAAKRPIRADFWRATLARKAAVLLAARRHPGRMPTALDLIAVGWSDAPHATCDAAVAHTAQALGLAA